MTLIDRARHLLTCDELRGQLPDEVAEFLREVVALEPVASVIDFTFGSPVIKPSAPLCLMQPLYTLETPHAPE